MGQTGDKVTLCSETEARGHLRPLKSKRSFKEDGLHSDIKGADRDWRNNGAGHGRHSLVPLQSVLQLFGEQTLLPNLRWKRRQRGVSDMFPATPPSDVATLPLIKLCRGFCPRWLTWQLEQGKFKQLGSKKAPRAGLTRRLLQQLAYQMVFTIQTFKYRERDRLALTDL